ncbi:hypothetical protein OOT33_08880 [Sphingobium sp. DEHP117]|jgi:hypothetical protein|uniref:hypothetical protein n=1 Tax=Sphingobium sp. DEHP117 TaxID=2993436 RepID=UPI0027D4D289|nr:hypothetical protein [Sphingobium sp. DEHP117]MDQ4420543.1 hypothetical protein [Sphingobium sp. DEHP117]
MILVALIFAAATPADAVPKARQAYASCLSQFTNDAVDRKMPKEEFVPGLNAKCADKEAKFRAALVAANRADGMSEKDSAADAEDQVKGYIEQMTDNFASGN